MAPCRVKLNTLSRVSQSNRSGLIFPVSRIQRYLRTHNLSLRRISPGAAVYSAAVLEYLVAEVLELSGNAMKAHNRQRIQPRHIMLAVRNDEELNKLLQRVIISNAGVLPSRQANLVHSNLSVIPTKNGRRRTILTTNDSKKTSGKSKLINANTTHMNILSERKLHLGQKLFVLQNDITEVQADALIHPTNSGFFVGGQVGNALKRKGGQALLDNIANCLKDGPLPSNNARICEAANLPVTWIINCHGPSWGAGDGQHEILCLTATIKACLSLADEKSLKSVSFPSVGSGQAGFPKQLAAQTILRAIRSYFEATVQSSVKQVYFVLFDKESVNIYTSELQKLEDQHT